MNPWEAWVYRVDDYHHNDCYGVVVGFYLKRLGRASLLVSRWHLLYYLLPHDECGPIPYAYIESKPWSQTTRRRSNLIREKPTIAQ